MNKYKLINKTTGTETLCDKVTIDGFDYYIDDYISDEVNGDLTKIPFNKLMLISVATTNPNIDIPKVVDEVERLALEYENSFTNGEGNADVDFKAGYNKSQETHPNSDEDMIEFAVWKDKNKFSVISTKEDWVSELLEYSGCVYTTKELLELWKKQQPKIVYYE